MDLRSDARVIFASATGSDQLEGSQSSMGHRMHGPNQAYRHVVHILVAHGASKSYV